MTACAFLIMLGLGWLFGCSSLSPIPPPNPNPIPISIDIFVISGISGVYTVHSDGTGKKQLTTKGELAALSYDGKQIAYVDNGKLWVIDVNGANKKEIVLAAGAQAPSWSRDGKLGFTNAIPGTQKVGFWVMDSFISIPRIITPSDRFFYFGMLSPDGTKFCVTENTIDHREIWIGNSDGSGLRALTTPTQDLDGPDANGCAWSHDGIRVAFFCGFEENNPIKRLHQNVCVINSDGTNRKTLTNCSGSPFDPSNPNGCASDGPGWSPDDKQIFYTKGSISLGGSQTWIMNIDGTNQHMMFKEPYGGGRSPWGPKNE